MRAVPKRSSVFLQTKVPGCRSGTAASCADKTEQDFETDLNELGLPFVDSVLLHGPPGPHGAACKSDVSCAAAAGQWAALEKLYAANKTRSIGVRVAEKCFTHAVLMRPFSSRTGWLLL
eukprot:COSAG02_NODE_2263_length_9312_cov_3.608054_6_plen_119_part_00